MEIISKFGFITILVSLVVGITFVSANNSFQQEKIMIPGKYMEAWKISFDDFHKIDDLTADEKSLEHYDIEFGEDKECYIIEFIPRLLSEEIGRKMKKMVIGRNIKYWIEKINMKIKKREFYKA